MSVPVRLLCVGCLVYLACLIAFTTGQMSGIGTATIYQYEPPYTTHIACEEYSNKFKSNWFAAAGFPIWEGPESTCGRKITLSCINGDIPGACASNQTVTVPIVDCACTATAVAGSSGPPGNHTFSLSEPVFRAIANKNASHVNIQYNMN